MKEDLCDMIYEDLNELSVSDLEEIRLLVLEKLGSKPTSEPKKANVYVHSSKEQNYEIGKRAGLTEAQLENFVYACYEVELNCEVDEFGHADIVGVNGLTFTD